MTPVTKLTVKVIPNSAKDQIVGWLDGRLKIKVRAQPEKGRANKAVIELLAKSLDILQKEIELIAGDTNALKVFEFKTMTNEGLHERINTLIKP